MGITFKVETHPEFTAEELALKLAEALQGQFNAQQDIVSHRQEKQSDEKKIFELEGILVKVENFKKNRPAFVSRMEPLASYDCKQIVSEILEIKTRLNDWDKQIVDSTKRVEDLGKKSLTIQKELEKLKQ